MSAAWLFLIAVELFCPALCDGQTTTPQDGIPKSEINVSAGQQDILPVTFSLSACNHQNQNHEQIVCNDECLCHATAIPSLGIAPPKKLFVRSEPMAFELVEPVTNSLPPPYHPPKIS